MTKRKTIKLPDGRAIRIAVRSRSCMGNPIGFRARVYVNDVQERVYHATCLSADEALDWAYSWWVQTQKPMEV